MNSRGDVRFCRGCVKRTRRLRCGGCGQGTITLRRHVEWGALCHLAELGPGEYLTAAGLWKVAGNGIPRQEFGRIMRGLAKRGLARRRDGPRYYREPGALVEYHLGMKPEVTG